MYCPGLIDNSYFLYLSLFWHSEPCPSQILSANSKRWRARTLLKSGCILCRLSHISKDHRRACWLGFSVNFRNAPLINFSVSVLWKMASLCYCPIDRLYFQNSRTPGGISKIHERQIARFRQTTKYFNWTIGLTRLLNLARVVLKSWGLIVVVGPLALISLMSFISEKLIGLLI